MSIEGRIPDMPDRPEKKVRRPHEYGGSLNVNPKQGRPVFDGYKATSPDPHGVHAFARQAQKRHDDEVVAQREPNGSTNLERVFGFTDRGFNEYMGATKTKRISARKLQALSDEMADSDEPLVVYACAWAAEEAALHRRNPKEVEYDRARAAERGRPVSGDTYASRMAALGKAKERWADAADRISEKRQSIENPHVNADLLGFELRARGALAYVPSMEAVATMLGERELSDEEKAAAVENTRTKLIQLCETVLDLNGNDREFFNTRNGMCNELLASLMLQAPDGSTIFVPASVRQDHNPIRDLRGDLIGVSTTDALKKTLIQVTSVPNKPGLRFVVDVSTDLALPGHSSRPRDTLRSVVRRAREGVTPTVAAELDITAQKLQNRYTAFVSNKEA